jgi:transposase
MAIVSQTAIIKTEIIHGSFNSISFLEFMKSLDIPIKSVILLDNVRFHYSKAVAQFAETRQWDLCFVPPYSPWFNPIEGVL